MSIVKTDIGGNITVRRIRSRCNFHRYASDWLLLQFMMPRSWSRAEAGDKICIWSYKVWAVAQHGESRSQRQDSQKL